MLITSRAHLLRLEEAIAEIDHAGPAQEDAFALVAWEHGGALADVARPGDPIAGAAWIAAMLGVTGRGCTASEAVTDWLLDAGRLARYLADQQARTGAQQPDQTAGDDDDAIEF